jgi:hypothetical protein
MHAPPTIVTKLHLRTARNRNTNLIHRSNVGLSFTDTAAPSATTTDTVWLPSTEIVASSVGLPTTYKLTPASRGGADTVKRFEFSVAPLFTSTTASA